MPGDLRVQLSHQVPDQKPHNTFMRKREEGDVPAHPGQRVPVEVLIRDGRAHDLKLDEASFELRQHPTALTTEDFYADDGKVKTDYYGELKALLTKVTGSSHVLVFHHQVRNQEKVSKEAVQKDGSVNTSTPVQPYATDAIHTDSSCAHAETFFKQMVAGQPEQCRRGRFLYINVWRNIAATPIQNHHLAVLDERSLVKPDDYIESTLFGVGYDVLQYRLSSRNTRSHRWYYFPEMARDEVLLFKQWDSDPQLSGRTCFHTAVEDAGAPAAAPPRQSIEARAMVFFPEHEPNTCPPMPRLVEAGGEACDEVRAQEGAGRLAGAVRYIQGSESTRLMVVGFMKGMHASGGAAAVLAEFAEDKQGHMGLTGANAATKARAVELAMQAGLAREVDALFSGPSAARVALATVCESRLTAAALGALSALAVKAILRRARR